MTIRGTVPFNVTRSFAAVAVFGCTLQAIYWPLVMKPGTELMWWQVAWMAKTGKVVGSAPVLVSLATSFGVSGVPLESLFWLYSSSWAVGLYWVVGRLADLFQGKTVRVSAKRFVFFSLSLYLTSFMFGALDLLSRWTPAMEYLSRPGRWLGSLFFIERRADGFVTPQFLILAVASDYLLYMSVWYVLATRLLRGRISRTHRRAY